MASSRARRPVGWEEFGGLMRELALAVARVCEPDVVVGIARGGAIVGCTLSFLLRRDFYPIRLQKQGRAVKVVIPPSPDLAGLHVLLVDDFTAAGDTFRIARHELARVGAAQVTEAALVRRVPGYSPRVWALEVSDKVRLPWAAEELVDGALRKRP